MTAALQSLKSVVSKQNTTAPLGQMRFRPQVERLNFFSSSLRLPPIEVVMALFRDRNKADHLDAFFEICYPYSTFDEFKETLKSVYFSTEGYSTATGVLIHGGLYYLFLEGCALSKKNDDFCDPAMTANMILCKDNLELCLDNLELLIAATDENIHALLLGATFAVETSKPSLCWSLTTAAIGLAQNLGYHRADSPCESRDLRARRSFAFWSLYLLDKSLSLRLGRAPTTQDFDITIAPQGSPSDSDHPSSKIWTDLMSCWIQNASIQGRIYEKLYSPSALSSSPQARMTNATVLAREMEELRQKWSKVRSAVCG